MNISSFRSRHILNASSTRHLPDKPSVPSARPLRALSTYRASGEKLDVWQSPYRDMQGKPQFRVWVFPDKPECKIAGVHDGDLHVHIKGPRKGGNETLLSFLTETLGLNGEVKIVIAKDDRRHVLKGLRFERHDGQQISLEDGAAFLQRLNLTTEILVKAPPRKPQPYSHSSDPEPQGGNSQS